VARRHWCSHTGDVRVLVVDDEVGLTDAVALGLRAEGFDVDVSHDGLDGLWRAREVDYAAIVLDLLLPGMNGFEVCRTLRAEGNWTPILMLTAKSGEYDEAEALDTGADDFLSKPFSFVVLVARVRAVARRGSVPRPATLVAGDVVVDPAAREARVGGAPVDLTPREFALLEALARRWPQVATKGELLDEVWGSDRDIDPNAVEVYIGYLRRKVGRDTIQTVRGAGYRVAGR
jgi:two-component system, OmpR family, response regulator